MRWTLLCLGLLAALPLWASPREDAPGRVCSEGLVGPVECVRAAHFSFDVCGQIERQARRHGIDPHFYARLLWQESRFDPNALSPANAMGIAQFIRTTADLRGLKDPYNPASALEHSAEYLGVLTRRYGNMGLAAVAYNGGERRADGLLLGRGLARETVHYVRIITGLPAEVWRDSPPETPDFRLDGDTAFLPACLAMAAQRRVSALRVTPDLREWGAQISFGPTEAAARRNFERVAHRCALMAHAPADIVFVPNRVRGRPSYHMARISRDSRSEAARICQQAQARGCACAVYRNW